MLRPVLMAEWPHGMRCPRCQLDDLLPDLPNMVSCDRCGQTRRIITMFRWNGHAWRDMLC